MLTEKRDLKLGNIFLSEEMSIKIGDMGLATQLEYATQRRRTLCGTPNYIAPEILVKKEKFFDRFDLDLSLGPNCVEYFSNLI